MLLALLKVPIRGLLPVIPHKCKRISAPPKSTHTRFLFDPVSALVTLPCSSPEEQDEHCAVFGLARVTVHGYIILLASGSTLAVVVYLCCRATWFGKGEQSYHMFLCCAETWLSAHVCNKHLISCPRPQQSLQTTFRGSPDCKTQISILWVIISGIWQHCSHAVGKPCRGYHEQEARPLCPHGMRFIPVLFQRTGKASTFFLGS